MLLKLMQLIESSIEVALGCMAYIASITTLSNDVFAPLNDRLHVNTILRKEIGG